MVCENCCVVGTYYCHNLNLNLHQFLQETFELRVILFFRSILSGKHNLNFELVYYGLEERKSSFGSESVDWCSTNRCV